MKVLRWVWTAMLHHRMPHAMYAILYNWQARWANATHPPVPPNSMQPEPAFVTYHYIPNWSCPPRYTRFFAPHFNTFLSLIHQHGVMMHRNPPLVAEAFMSDLQDAFNEEFPHTPITVSAGWHQWSYVGHFQRYRIYWNESLMCILGC